MALIYAAALRAFLLVFACLFSAPLLAQGWQARLDNNSGILQVLSADYIRHPGMLFSGERTFRPDFIELMREAQSVSVEFNLPADRFLIPDSMPALSMQYQSSQGGLEFDSVKVEALKADIKKTLSELRAFAPRWAPKDLESMLASSEFRSDPKMAAKFLQILPWFVDSDGKLALETSDTDHEISSKIESSDGQSLTIRYYDHFKNHLLHTIEDYSGGWKHACELYSAQFAEKELKDGVSLHRNQSGVGRNAAVSIELVPPLISLIKIFDCSMKTIPFYPLLPDTHVFWIRRTKGVTSQPSGYALVHMVDMDGVRIPYVVTINGSTLNEVDTRAALVLIAQHFNVDHVAVPDFEFNSTVVNDKRKIEGMAGETKVRARLSNLWHQMAERDIVRLNLKGRSKGYYHPSSVKYAKITSITVTEKIQFSQTGRRFQSQSHYARNDHRSLSVRDRATLLAGMNTKSVEQFQKDMDVPASALEAAQKYVKISDYADSAVSETDLNLVVNEFGINPMDIVKRLTPHAQIKTLGQLNQKPAWAAPLAIKLAADLDQQLFTESTIDEKNGRAVHLLKQRQKLIGFEGVANVSLSFVRPLVDRFLAKGPNDPELNSDLVEAVRVEFLHEIRERLLSRLGVPANEITSENLTARCIEASDSKLQLIGYRLLIVTKTVPDNPKFVINALANMTQEHTQILFQLLLSISRDEMYRYDRSRQALGILHAPHLYSAPFIKENRHGQLLVLKLINEIYFRSDRSIWQLPLQAKIFEFIKANVTAGVHVAELTPLMAHYLRSQPEVWELLKDKVEALDPAALKYLVVMNDETPLPEWFWTTLPKILTMDSIEPAVQEAVGRVLLFKDRWTQATWIAVAERLGTAGAPVKRALLRSLSRQKIWTLAVWDRVLKILEAEKDLSVIAALEDAIRYRVLPEAHKAALKILVLEVYNRYEALPESGNREQKEATFHLFQRLDSTRAHNVGVRLTEFPNPEDRHEKWNSCADRLARAKFKARQDNVPWWIQVYRVLSGQ